MQQVGKLFVIMGPSGVGKTTLVNALVALPGCENLFRVPTYTTRQPRPGEVDGIDYCFVTDKQFQAMLADEQLLEWSRAYRAFYGLGREKVATARTAGKTVMAVVDRLGAIQVKRLLPDTVVILIAAPSIEELRRRLEKRSSETTQNIDFRLQQAVDEIEQEKLHPIADYVVINSSIEQSVEQLKTIICSEQKCCFLPYLRRYCL